jgi:hypothetical protein
MMNKLTIRLPWPPPGVRQNEINSRSKFSSMGAIRKERVRCAQAVLAQIPNAASLGLGLPKRVFVSLAFYPPNNRYDHWNLPGACKPMLDGVAGAFCVNDKIFTFGERALVWGEVNKENPHVLATLEWGAEA